MLASFSELNCSANSSGKTNSQRTAQTTYLRRLLNLFGVLGEIGIGGMHFFSKQANKEQFAAQIKDFVCCCRANDQQTTSKQTANVIPSLLRSLGHYVCWFARLPVFDDTLALMLTLAPRCPVMRSVAAIRVNSPTRDIWTRNSIVLRTRCLSFFEKNHFLDMNHE